MVRIKPEEPHGNGEMLARPPVDEWPALLQRTRALREGWDFEVAGISATVLAERARGDAVAAARSFSARLGIPLTDAWSEGDPIAMTGHQPELYHPGVWIKDFLLERITRETGALGIDVVVDTDAFDALTIEAPCMRPTVGRCREYLAIGGPDVCYCTPNTLDPAEIRRFSDLSLEMLGTLPAPSVARHFAEFSTALESSAADAASLAELVTFARRRYEASAGSGYLELPVTAIARTEAYHHYVADIVLRAEEFADTYDGQLREYRLCQGIRNDAQPFPDLLREEGRVELPFWLVRDGRRSAAWARPRSDDVAIESTDGDLAMLLPLAAEAASGALGASDALVAPRAVTLTLFLRTFIADLFIHGVGGGRYDAVTDAVATAWYGIRPPDFAVASLTLYLPLGAHLVTDDELASAADDVNRIEHNPDQMLDRIDFETSSEREAANALAAEKAELVERIRDHGADKKALGSRIREVNGRLGELLLPLRAELEQHLQMLREERATADVLTDRTYPFAYWAPADVADKAW